MKWRLPLVVFVVAALAAFAFTVHAQPGPPHTYTCVWDHDGVSTDHYEIWVDGAAAVANIQASACMAGPPRVCSSPLTMTTNVSHVVLVKAVNAFGEASSDPFSASPPSSRPAAVVVR